MERKMLVYMGCQLVLLVCGVPLVFGGFEGILLAVVAISLGLVGPVAYCMVHKMLMLIYIVCAALAPIGYVIGSIIWFLTADEWYQYWPIPVSIVLMITFITAAISGFLYYREI